MNIENLVHSNNALTNREIAFLTGLSPCVVWKLMKRLEKYKVVVPRTSKFSNNGSVIYWEILNKDEFLSELQRRMV